MKKSLQNRLKQYSIAAGALAGCSSASAQVMHTNVNPDSLTTGFGNSYNLDINNDNIVDFIIDIAQSTSSGSFTFTSGFFNYNQQRTGVRIDPQSNNAVFGYYPQAMSAGLPILNQSYGWASYGARPVAQNIVYSNSYSFNTYYGSTIYGSNQGTWQAGNFHNAQSKYMGLRIELNGNFHYGWVRLDVPSVDSFIVKNYAVNLTSDQMIITGDTGLVTNSSPALSVTAADIANSGNGSDIEVNFGAGNNESTVLLYRIIAVKETNAASFTLTDAQNVGSGEYLPVIPNGSATYTETLFAGMKDSDGDNITVNVPYKLFVHTWANGFVAVNDALSAPSDTVVLESSDASIAPVQSVNIFDVNNNGNGLDLEVNFNALADETYLQEYRIFIVKANQAGGFGLNAAESNTHYKTVLPTGQNISVTLEDDSKSTDGVAIQNGVAYRAFVMSVADGTNVTDNFLSSASNELTLSDAVGIKSINKDVAKISYLNEAVLITSQTGTAFNKIELYTSDGRLVSNLTENKSTHQIAYGTHAAGLYLVKLTIEQGEFFEKVVLR